MPKISPDGNTIIFKILPHYFQLVEEGKKWATLRELDNKWLSLLKQAKYIQFERIDVGQDDDAPVIKTIDFLIEGALEVPVACKRLYKDCPWPGYADTKLILIVFVGHRKIEKIY